MMPVTSALLLALQLAQTSNPNLQQGIAAFREGRYSVALAKLDEAAKNPRDKLAVVFLGLTQAAVGHCREALPRLTDRSLAVDDTTERLRGVAAARCYATEGESDKAWALLAELAKKYPRDADILYTSAKLHMKAFNDATFAMFQRDPSSFRVHELSGEIFEVQNRYTEAAAEYRKAIDLNPNAPDLHFRLGRALLLESHAPGSLEAAAGEFRHELTISPEDAACEFQLGQIAQVEGQGKKSRVHLERALSLSPEFVQALIALGKLDTHEKRYPEAIRELRRATELEPANEAAHYALLTAYRDSGDLASAQTEKTKLDELQKPPPGEFSDFLKKLEAQQPKQ